MNTPNKIVSQETEFAARKEDRPFLSQEEFRAHSDRFSEFVKTFAQETGIDVAAGLIAPGQGDEVLFATCFHGSHKPLEAVLYQMALRLEQMGVLAAEEEKARN